MQHHPEVYLRGTCRSCRGMLHEFLNLGALRLNEFPLYPHDTGRIPKIPLILTVCVSCSLVQLDRTVPPDWLYRTYWYRSGINESMVAELRDIVDVALTYVHLDPGDWVLDIGANDGTLLSMYPQLGVLPKRVAVEPAYNLTERLQEHADIVVHDYWPVDPKRQPWQFPQPFKIITAIACAYDTEDPRGFFQAIANALHPEGVAIIQFQDFEQQLQASAFDTICHEHLEYYTLWSLLPLLQQAGLEALDVHQTPINGGSLRVTAGHARPHVSVNAPRVIQQLAKEEAAGLSPDRVQHLDYSAYYTFRQRVMTARAQIGAVLHQLRLEGKILDIYGASTKGNILLQVMGIGPVEARQAIDRSEEKWGKHTVTGIPIVSETQAMSRAADVWLCPIWQFRDFVLTRERWYLERGGTIIFPLPAVEIVRESW